MSIIAMRVSGVEPHPDADALRVLQLDAPGIDLLQVVANTDHAYAPGDRVIVARVGAVLLDGTTIRRARLRGVYSFGMILGTTDAAPGTDLRATHGQPPEPEPAAAPATAERPAGVSVFKWPSIESLPHVRRAVRQQARLDSEAVLLPTITYRAKIKLDGTNAGVHVLPGGRIVAQSRTRLLSPDDDNHGFATWVHAHGAYFGALFERLGHALVFGEWCGPGIQKKVAITRIERKIFAVFAIQLGDPATEAVRLVVEPERIAALLPEHPDVRVLPWHGEPVALDFHDDAGLEPGVARLNEMVAEIEQVDPWVAEQFGVEGVGEGVVLYPVGGVDFDAHGGTNRDRYAELMFKAKGEAHRVQRQPKAVQVDPQVAADVRELVDQFVTPARLEQAVTEGCDGELSMRRMGDFLGWLGRDVQKESTLELEASGLTWKQVARAVASTGQQWYRRRVAEADER
ncbi:MAG: hypothetical protein KDK70_00890 [Myxococcales bacterium]|nr:hypothetical protein [Myxococcales bacterium]